MCPIAPVLFLRRLPRLRISLYYLSTSPAWPIRFFWIRYSLYSSRTFRTYSVISVYLLYFPHIRIARCLGFFIIFIYLTSILYARAPTLYSLNYVGIQPPRFAYATRLHAGASPLYPDGYAAPLRCTYRHCAIRQMGRYPWRA